MRHPAFRLAVPAPYGLAGGLLLAGAVLAGCAGGKPTAGQAAAPGSPSRSQQPGRAGFGGTGGPAAFGLLAEIDAHVLQVQNQSTGQVSVSYSASTEFSQTKQVTRTALRVGDCVTAIGQRSAPSAGSASAGSPSAGSPSAGSPSASPPAGSSGQPSRPTSFAAASVQISSAVNGSCVTGGLGGARGGTRPSGFPSGRPSGFPSGRPSDRPSGQRGGFGFGDFATGKVSSLSAAGMTVQGPGRGSQQATSTTTVTLSASTSYTETMPATAAALRVGECVTATGKADSTGAVAASRIALSPATGGNCTTGGFGRRPAASASTTGS